MCLDVTNLKELKAKFEESNEIRTAHDNCASYCASGANCSCSPAWFGYQAWTRYFAKGALYSVIYP